MSIVVSTPSSRIPDSSHSPLTPAPVPTSTTALPPRQPGQQAQQRADRGGDGAGADVVGAFAGRGQDRVLGDRALGVRDHRLGATWRRTVAGRFVCSWPCPQRRANAGATPGASGDDAPRRHARIVRDRPICRSANVVARGFLRKSSVCSYARHTPIDDGSRMERGGSWSGNSDLSISMLSRIRRPAGVRCRQPRSGGSDDHTLMAPTTMSHLEQARRRRLGGAIRRAAGHRRVRRDR